MVTLFAFLLTFFLLNVILLSPQGVFIVEFFIMGLSGKDLYVVFFWDMMSHLFSSVVLMIACVVFFYASYYMDSDKARMGFIFLLFSFVASMIMLLISPQLITLLLGWDGLGMTSYLLVIYYSSSSSSSAGMLTFLTNRLGDVFFLISMGAFALFFDWEQYTSSYVILALLLLLAFSTKSAQVPFSAWLPAAMAAPTPVSSLVHSSTLVTAGLYLMIRFSNTLYLFNKFILWLGVFTLMAAGLMALFEWDLKKLIAFSTLSQLGFMVSSYAMGLIWVSFFHLLTHALFKASLFLSAGILIHNADNSQEFRNMFVVPFQLYWVSSIVNICLLCLCGIPFTSGFYSKDLIVDGGSFSFFLFILYLLSVGLTVVYSSRFFYFSHRDFYSRFVFSLSYDKIWYTFLPLSFLVLMAILGGWFFFESFFSFKFFVVLSSGWKMVYFFLLFLLGLFSFYLNKAVLNNYKEKFFFSTIWYLKSFCMSKFWKNWFILGFHKITNNDQGSLESLGPQGVFSALMALGLGLFSFQSFLFFVYFLFFLFGLFMF